jgi:hypothetical protein
MNAEDRIKELEDQLETESMRLAACGVVALADTALSHVEDRKMLSKYRSASLSYVERRVDECIELREKLAAMTEERNVLASWKRQMLMVDSEWNPQTVGELLGVTLGQPIRAHIEPKIRELIAQRNLLLQLTKDAMK